MTTFAAATRPRRTKLEGTYVVLEPLAAAEHTEGLVAADRAGSPGTWEFLPYGPWASVADHERWLLEQERSEDPMFWSVMVGSRALGVATLMSIVPAHGRIEIGHVWFSEALQRTRAATECFHLLARHAFDAGNRRLEWKCDAANAASRRAAERLGFTFEGVFRQHQWIKGRNRDTAWLSMLDSEWPRVAAGFEAWLDPANFAADGFQRTRLKVRD